MKKKKQNSRLIILKNGISGASPISGRRQAPKMKFFKDYPPLTFYELWKIFLENLKRPLYSLKYRLQSFYLRYFDKINIPFLKIGVLCLVAYFLMSKDLQFQISLKSPFGEGGQTISQNVAATNNTAQAVALDENSMAPASLSEIKDKQARDYVQEFTKVAMEEMKMFEIPASIKMAQALLESRAGNSRLARESNNHFGMKCKRKCLGCTCRNYSDDDKFDMFRVFDSPWESWRAHSELLSDNSRYSKLKKYKYDYKSWAKGLKSAGYATDKTYDRKLIRVIEKYKLYKLDELALKN